MTCSADCPSLRESPGDRGGRGKKHSSAYDPVVDFSTALLSGRHLLHLNTYGLDLISTAKKSRFSV
jgi:hypothetical protein